MLFDVVFSSYCGFLIVSPFKQVVFIYIYFSQINPTQKFTRCYFKPGWTLSLSHTLTQSGRCKL